MNLSDLQASQPATPLKNVEIIANSLGSGDWMQIKVNGVVVDEGHSISRHMVVRLLEWLGHDVKEVNVGDDWFP